MEPVPETGRREGRYWGERRLLNPFSPVKLERSAAADLSKRYSAATQSQFLENSTRLGTSENVSSAGKTDTNRPHYGGGT